MNVLFIREDQNAKAKIHLNSAHRQGAYALFKYLCQGQRNKYARRKGIPTVYFVGEDVVEVRV